MLAISTETRVSPFKQFKQYLSAVFDREGSVNRLFLGVAGVLYVTNGLVYFTAGLTDPFNFTVDISLGIIYCIIVGISFFSPVVKKALWPIVHISVYLIPVQTLIETSTHQFEMDQLVALLVCFMICPLPLKKVKEVNIYVLINFALIITVGYLLPKTAVDPDIITYIFFAGSAMTMVALGARLIAMAKLEKNEQFFKNMFNESAGANFLTDMQSMKTVSCNKKAGEMFEAYDDSQLIGMDPQLFQVASFDKVELDKVKNEIKDNWGFSKEVQFRTLKGRIFWGNLEYRAVQFQNKPFLQVRITDISDRKRLENLLMAEKEVLEIASKVDGLEKPFTALINYVEEICESMKCAIMFTDKDGQSLKFGYSAGINRMFVNKIEQYSLRTGTGINHTAMITKKPVELNTINLEMLKHDNPQLTNLDGLHACHAYPILSEDGNVLGTLAVYFYNNKISHGQELEIIGRVINICRTLMEKEIVVEANKEFVTTLQVTNAELKKTNDELDRFVYSTSHDLRVPLTNVMGLIDVTNMTIKDDAPRKYLDMMKDSVVALDDVIRGILDYSRNSRSEVQVEEVNLKEVVKKTQDMLKQYNGFSNFEFRVKTDESVPLYTDKYRLTVVLTNLISNAVKYANKAETHKFISITALITTEKAILFVEDNGIGIPEEYHQKIFDMFYRASSQSNGSGLGLYILNETLHKLHGKISVVSGKDIGSTFVVELPNLMPEKSLKLSA